LRTLLECAATTVTLRRHAFTIHYEVDVVNNKLMQFLLTVGLLSPLLFGANAALSQSASADESIESMTVVGARQYRGDFERMETPQAELTIDATVLRNAGALDLVQALDLSASVARQNNFGGLWNSFALRGFVGDENLPSNYLVNGFNAGRGFGGARDLAGIEAVEVLKGPRAALFGRGEPGGTVNLVTKRPTFESKSSLRHSTDRWDLFRTDVDVDVPLVADTLAVRLVGFYEDSESFRDTVETEKRGFYPSLAWRISDMTQVSLEAEVTEQLIPFDRGVVAVNGELGHIPQSRFLGDVEGDGRMLGEVLGVQFELKHDLGNDWNLLLGANYRGTSLEGHASEPQFGGRQALKQDPDSGNLSRFQRYRDYDSTYTVFRAELSGKMNIAGYENRFIAGIDLDMFENEQFARRLRGIDRGALSDQVVGQQLRVINIHNPTYGQALLRYDRDMHLNDLTDREETQESTGIYVQNQISLNEFLHVRFGLRYDDYEQEYEDRRATTRNPDGSLACCHTPTDKMNIRPASTTSDSNLSPQLGVVFEVNDDLSAYAVYGQNFRPLSGADTNNEGFSPNESTSYEFGVHFTTLNGALDGTAAVFFVEQDNLLSGPSDDRSSIGEAESQGLELDLHGELAQGLSLWLSYAYVDAETKNAYVDGVSENQVAAGSRLLNIPENQLSLQLTQATQMFGKDATLGFGLLNVGDRLGETGTDFELPEYTTARLFADWHMSENVRLRMDLDNMFNEKHYTNSFADVWVQPGAPRNLRLSADVRFW